MYVFQEKKDKMEREKNPKIKEPYDWKLVVGKRQRKKPNKKKKRRRRKDDKKCDVKKRHENENENKTKQNTREGQQ